MTKTRAREGGASVFTSFVLFFLYSVPPSARKKFWPFNQAGEKEGGWGEGIFARLFCAVGAVGREAFPPFGVKPNIKAKQFSIPFKKNLAGAGIKKLKENCFAEFIPHLIAGLAEFRRAETRSGANQSFSVQKRFELRSVIATNQDISNFQGKGFARLPRLRRGYARIFPYISELNRKGGQIQIQFFGKANGGSACEARNKQSLFPFFLFFAKGKNTKQVFLIPRFQSKATNN